MRTHLQAHRARARSHSHARAHPNGCVHAGRHSCTGHHPRGLLQPCGPAHLHAGRPHANTPAGTYKPHAYTRAHTDAHTLAHACTHMFTHRGTRMHVCTHTYFSCKHGLLTSWQESKVSGHAKVWTQTRPSGSVHFHAADNSRSFPPAPRRGVSSPQGQFLRTQLIRNHSFTIIVSVRVGSRAPSSCRTERARETEENPPENLGTPLRKPAQAETSRPASPCKEGAQSPRGGH